MKLLHRVAGGLDRRRKSVGRYEVVRPKYHGTCGMISYTKQFEPYPVFGELLSRGVPLLDVLYANLVPVTEVRKRYAKCELSGIGGYRLL